MSVLPDTVPDANALRFNTFIAIIRRGSRPLTLFSYVDFPAHHMATLRAAFDSEYVDDQAILACSHVLHLNPDDVCRALDTGNVDQAFATVYL